jgi:sulfur-carrier protein adenylyltransferase/sulfurtransferase
MTARYGRQMVLPEVGEEGQARLAAARVLVVGAGGLGCTLLPALAGAGVGRITIVDHDLVEESNLHRQPLYRVADIGHGKAETAAAALLAGNPEIAVAAVAERLSPANATEHVDRADIVVDAADNFAVTYALSDICRGERKPLVSASAIGLTGYAGTFCGGGPSYRSVFPDMPRTAANCATAGVLGPVVAVLGALQAQMSLALLLGLSPSPCGRLVTFDAKRLAFGGFDFTAASEPEKIVPFIAPKQITEGDIAIDLRGLDEAPVSPVPQAIRAVLSDIDELAPMLPHGRRIVLCCRTGLRAARAAELLGQRGHDDLALVAFGDDPATP